MFDIGWPEFFLVAVIALIAVRPKDLPHTLYVLGLWAGKIRRFLYALQHDFDRLTFQAEQIERQKQDKKQEND